MRARAVIAHIELTGQQIEAQVLSADDFQDSDDMPVAEVFITANAQVLLTGNLRHFRPCSRRGRKFTPLRSFLSAFSRKVLRPESIYLKPTYITCSLDAREKPYMRVKRTVLLLLSNQPFETSNSKNNRAGELKNKKHTRKVCFLLDLEKSQRF